MWNYNLKHKHNTCLNNLPQKSWALISRSRKFLCHSLDSVYKKSYFCCSREKNISKRILTKRILSTMCKCPRQCAATNTVYHNDDHDYRSNYWGLLAHILSQQDKVILVMIMILMFIKCLHLERAGRVTYFYRLLKKSYAACTTLRSSRT